MLLGNVTSFPKAAISPCFLFSRTDGCPAASLTASCGLWWQISIYAKWPLCNCLAAAFEENAHCTQLQFFRVIAAQTWQEGHAWARSLLWLEYSPSQSIQVRDGLPPAKLNEKQMDMHLIKGNAMFVSVIVDKWGQCLKRYIACHLYWKTSVKIQMASQ